MNPTLTFPRPPVDLGRTNPDCVAPRHGTASAYARVSCRCEEARNALRIDHKRRREGRYTPRRVNGTGTKRRLQALAAIGWRWTDIAAHLEVSAGTIQIFATQRFEGVHHTTATRVAAVYDLLSMTPGPSGITRSRVLAKGWAPPLAWDDDTIDDPAAEPNLNGKEMPEPKVTDEVAIRRAINGEQRFTQLATTDRLELFRRYAEQMSNSELMRRLRISDDTARRWRQKAAELEQVAA